MIVRMFANGVDYCMNDFLVLMIFLLQLIEVLIILSLIGDVQDIRADLYYYSEQKSDSDELH